MDTFDTFHDVLVNLFREIMGIEEKAIITEEFKDLTNNDMHVIEAIGREEPKNMSSIAGILNVTVGTLTIAMNSLVKKGYVERKRSDKDRRIVYISLTERGVRAYNHHARFHQAMINAMIKDLSPEEVQVLVKALTNLKRFFAHMQEGQK